jgi:hypothetical protein
MYDGDFGEGSLIPPQLRMGQFNAGSNTQPLAITVSAEWTVWVPSTPLLRKIRIATDYDMVQYSNAFFNVTINDQNFIINSTNAVNKTSPLESPYQFLYDTTTFEWPYGDIMTVKITPGGEGINGSFIGLIDQVYIL